MGFSHDEKIVMIYHRSIDRKTAANVSLTLRGVSAGVLNHQQNQKPRKHGALKGWFGLLWGGHFSYVSYSFFSANPTLARFIYEIPNSLPNAPAFHHCNGIEPNGVQAGYNTKPTYEARGRIRKAYNRADYLEERAEMFQ